MYHSDLEVTNCNKSFLDPCNGDLFYTFCTKNFFMGFGFIFAGHRNQSRNQSGSNRGRTSRFDPRSIPKSRHPRKGSVFWDKTPEDIAKMYNYTFGKVWQYSIVLPKLTQKYHPNFGPIRVKGDIRLHWKWDQE